MLPACLLLPEKAHSIEVLSKTEPISRLAAQHQVSRPLLYQQGHKANEALDATFSAATDERSRALLPAHHQDLVISIDSGINPRLPLFVPRRRGTVAGFVRPACLV